MKTTTAKGQGEVIVSKGDLERINSDLNHASIVLSKQKSKIANLKKLVNSKTPEQQSSNEPIHQFSLNGYSWSQDEKGEWIWKAEESKPIVKVQSKYGDIPPFKAIEKLEDQIIANFDLLIKTGVKQIVMQLAVHHT